VQVFPEIFVEAQEGAEADSSEEEWNGESGGIDREEKNAAGDGFAGGGECENGGEDGADTGRPAKGESEAEKKAAEDAGLGVLVAEMDVTIKPAGELRAQESDDGEREEVAGAESGEKRAVAQE